jgi:hypothetical protein
MTTPVTGSTPESRAAALAMFEGQIPCVMQFAEPSCPETARWLAWFVHEENTSRCEHSEPQPLCDTHRKMIATATHPFWRTWHRTPPVLCDQCETPLRLERFDPL